MQKIAQQRKVLLCIFLMACVGVEAFVPHNLEHICSLGTCLRNQKDVRNVLHEKSSDSDDKDAKSYSSSQDIPSENSIDVMLNQIIADSINDASGKGAMNIMEDDEFKSGVAKIFDKASAEMKTAIEEVRQEQEELLEASSAKNAAKMKARLNVEQSRLEGAEKSMVKVMSIVEKEKAEVEKAFLELEEAQQNESQDLLRSVVSGGIVKQGALAGTILFTFRSITDLVLTFGGDSSHAMPALIQAALAIIFGAYIFFSRGS